MITSQRYLGPGYQAVCVQMVTFQMYLGRGFQVMCAQMATSQRCLGAVSWAVCADCNLTKAYQGLEWIRSSNSFKEELSWNHSSVYVPRCVRCLFLGVYFHLCVSVPVWVYFICVWLPEEVREGSGYSGNGLAGICWNMVHERSYVRRILRAEEKTPGKQGKGLITSVSP